MDEGWILRDYLTIDVCFENTICIENLTSRVGQFRFVRHGRQFGTTDGKDFFTHSVLQRNGSINHLTNKIISTIPAASNDLHNSSQFFVRRIKSELRPLAYPDSQPAVSFPIESSSLYSPDQQGRNHRTLPAIVPSWMWKMNALFTCSWGSGKLTLTSNRDYYRSSVHKRARNSPVPHPPCICPSIHAHLQWCISSTEMHYCPNFLQLARRKTSKKKLTLCFVSLCLITAWYLSTGMYLIHGNLNEKKRRNDWERSEMN